MNGDSQLEPVLARGQLLRHKGRHEEAERAFQDALRLDPNNAGVYCEIALCRLMAKARERDALQAIEHALSLEPEVAYFHAVRSMILHDLGRYPEAVAAADQAIALNPDEAIAHLARGHALCGTEDWGGAEASTRRALEINPDYAAAHNLLSTLLRVQNRRAENREQIQFMLERDPEDADSHANAGWAALHDGDVAKAQTHFLEALRLEPENEIARRGLLDAYRARAWFYRRYLDYCLFMVRFTNRQRWAIIIGFLIAYRFLRTLAERVGPYCAAGVAGVYMLLVLWSHLARSVGNFIVLTDRLARRALNREERLDGAVGGLVLAGIACGAVALALQRWAPGAAAIFLLALSVPLSKVLLNESRLGRAVFGGASLLVLASGALLVLALAVPALMGLAQRVSIAAIFAASLSTFLGSIRALRVRSSR